MTNTAPFIAIRCAYIRAGVHFLSAVPLTHESEQEMSDDELEELAARRIGDVTADLKVQGNVVDSRIRVGFVSVKNKAFNFTSSEE